MHYNKIQYNTIRAMHNSIQYNTIHYRKIDKKYHKNKYKEGGDRRREVSGYRLV